ncbi:MAG: ATP-binding protein, partial [Anaerolineae bacterium]
MSEIERAASFYLGRLVDPDTGEPGHILQYDARDLTTHAVCVGMTGSGKTGLCIDLLEEAALEQIPSIIIDPKGDLTNMLLTFPDLRPEDFLPWVNVDDARRKNMSVEEYAGYVANLWAKGLADSGQGPERIRQLKQSADFVIFTPGSSAGVPVNILQSFAVPGLSWEEHEEELREKISCIVSALLSLAQVKISSTNDREHVLLSHLFERAWRAGEDLDLAALIMQVQKPPIRKLGVFDVDTYFPLAERMQLAMALNSVLASPSFAQWLEGVPLEIPQIIKAPDGRPRVAIFYIAHLSDAERMFFVTLLFSAVETWIRSQPGTPNLRAILYFDEIYGYLPPVSNPPSKPPLMRLLKQARAFGIGLVLVTQNP